MARRWRIGRKRKGVFIRFLHISIMLQDKGLQKGLFQKEGIASAPFALMEAGKKAHFSEKEKSLLFPGMLKLCRMGYDGKGVFSVPSEEDFFRIWKSLQKAPCVVEKQVSIDKEWALIIARTHDGHTQCYPPVEMVFDSKGHVLDYLLAPADISVHHHREMLEVAQSCGIVAVATLGYSR